MSASMEPVHEPRQIKPTSRRRASSESTSPSPSSSSSSNDHHQEEQERSRKMVSSHRIGRGGLLPMILSIILIINSIVLPPVTAQHDFSTNLTDISGTWSSGSGAVRTGPGFANPANFTFTYPKTAGISMSFTNDGFWEEAQYRFISNGTRPNCVKAIVFWQHGRYTFEANGSLTMQPIAVDGRMQIQDPCAAQTSVMTYYYQPGLYQTWQIYNDVHHNTYNLQLQAFDNALFPRLYLVTRPPTMLPTEQISKNSTKSSSSKKKKRSITSDSTVGKGGGSNDDDQSNSIWKRWYNAWSD